MAELRRLRVLALSATLACGLVVAACSGGGSGTATGTADPGGPGTSGPVDTVDAGRSGTTDTTAATDPQGPGATDASTSTAVVPITVKPATTGEVAAATAADPADFRVADFGGGMEEMSSGVYFTTPSGNITCFWGLGLSGLQDMVCRLHHRADPPPVPPDGCGPLSWHDDVILYDRSSGLEDGICSSGVVGAVDANVLPYGSALTYDGLACLSAVDGVTCIDTGTGEGFFLSRSTFTAVP